ncbi:MAG: cyclase family protein [Bdellovibrionales bacterium]
MPYFLSPIINDNFQEMWMEGKPYSKNNIYQISEGAVPPVNYDSHTLKPHSLTHCEAPLHTQKNGASIEEYFKKPEKLFGKARVLRLEGNGYRPVDVKEGIFHWEVSLKELKNQLNEVPEKLILTSDHYPIKESTAFHNPNYVLTLSQEAADWLLSSPKFNMYGTSWKSSDYKPGSNERPIHNTLFKQASIFECLDLKIVPDGDYFFVGSPLPIEGASESPASPMLFTKEELTNIF